MKHFGDNGVFLNKVTFVLFFCLCLLFTGPANAQKSDSSNEVSSITVRGKTIKIGDKTDDVFTILKGEEKTRPPAVDKNTNYPYGLIVTHFYRLGNKVLEVTCTLTEANGPYRVKRLVLRGSKSNLGEPEFPGQLPKNLPTYEVTGREGPSISILVPPKTTKEQLIALLQAFRTAREHDAFLKMNPPITQGSIKGDVVTVMIYVFSNPTWATEAKLKQFLSPKDLETKKNRLGFVKSLTKNIKAYYYYGYNALSGEPFIEEGTIGYSTQCYDDKIITQDYQKIF
jgi:hypothetical protein